MIIPLEKFQEIRKKKFPKKTVVCTSGYFDPFHPGHTSCIMESKEFGDILVVLINGDQQCVTKKGKAFIPADDRAYMADCIKGVDYTIIYDHPTRLDSCEPIKIINPDVFTKGGDRDSSKNVPEYDIVEGHGGRIEFGVGKEKIWSSSFYLKEWEDFVKKKI